MRLRWRVISTVKVRVAGSHDCVAEGSCVAVRQGGEQPEANEWDVHQYNFADIPLWDRLFGTYKDTTEFAERCGFPKGAEEKLGDMLVFKDVYYEDPA